MKRSQKFETAKNQLASEIKKTIKPNASSAITKAHREAQEIIRQMEQRKSQDAVQVLS